MAGYAGSGYGSFPYAGQSGTAGGGPSDSFTVSTAEETDTALAITVVQHAASVQVSREHAEALVAVTPNANVSREHLETLIEVDPDARVSREHLEALVALTPNAILSREHIEVLYFDDGAQVAGVGTAVETDEALEIHAAGFVFPGVAEETDTAQPITVIGPRYFNLGQAEETDSAQTLAVVEARRFIVGLADETDTALPIQVAFPVKTATETDTALPIGIQRSIGIAAETDTALPVTPITQLGTPQEIDEARPIYIEWVSNHSGAVDGFGWTSGTTGTPGVPYSGSYLTPTSSPPAGAPFPAALEFPGSAIPNALRDGGYWADPTDGEYALVGASRRITIEVWAYLDGAPGALAQLSLKNYNSAQNTATGVGVTIDTPGQWVHWIETFVTGPTSPKILFSYAAGATTNAAPFPPTLYMAGLSIRTEPAYTQTTGPSAEQDTANPITPVHGAATFSVGQATETDAAQPISAAVATTVNRATETDEAWTITAVRGLATVAIGQAEEVDEARPVTETGVQELDLGQVDEVDTAQAIAVLQAQLVGVGIAQELDRAIVILDVTRVVEDPGGGIGGNHNRNYPRGGNTQSHFFRPRR